MRRYPGRFAAAAVSIVLAVTLVDLPAWAVTPEWEPPTPPDATDVPVSEIPAAPRPVWSAQHAVVTGDEPVTWPGAAVVPVDLPADSAARAGMARADGAPAPGRAGRAAAAGLPVRVGAAPMTVQQAEDMLNGTTPAPATAPARVQVQVADRAATAQAGVTGLLVGVARADGVRRAADVAVEVDYSGFRHAYGADWASRLRITALGGCTEMPVPGGVQSCRDAVALPTTNDYAAGTLAATVPLSADGGFTMFSVSAGASGDNGDYRATSLSPAGTWQVSQQTGGFAWSYPLGLVPGVNGPEPSLALAYSSQAVDGRTADTNTQGSWIGDGWDLWPGYVERSYRQCASDTKAVGGQDPNNKTNPTGDLCWFSDNATMSLNGRATELVKGSDGKWRGVADDGSRVERLTNTSWGNGDDNGEYWKVTTTDGMQYFFGRHRRPAYPTDTAATNSTWTVPVYGNHPGEPCYSAGSFAGSRCTQAWRWNLDYVVDPHGNSMSLFYSRETGAYGRELNPSLRTTYHRGGYLQRIEYGTRSGTEHSATIPARVMFDVADRCKPNSTCTESNPSAWPDTPWDQYCSAAPCTDQQSPTFWTQKRLAKIRAQVWRGSSHHDVESWTLRHEYLNAGDTEGDGIPMWLRGITHAGHVTTAGGSAVTDPEITFDPGGNPLANRVDGPADGRSALNRWRLHTITTESGAQIGVGYSATECTRSSLPTPHTNTKRCFPQWYAPPGLTPTLDWFHKYLVTRVDVWDLTGASAHQQTNYDYLDSPAWRYADSELVPEDKRTWSQWRGYGRVRVRQGLEAGTQSVTEYRYLRGMHGDRATPSGGTKSVQVTDSQGVSINDHEAHAGFLREETVYNGVGGAWVTGSINDPWRHGPTATSGPLKAWLTNTATTRTRTALSGGGTRWTRSTTSFDTTYGMATQIDDQGDESTTADDKCIRLEYARNTSLWLVDKISRTETASVRCATTPQRPAQVLSDARVFYDNTSTHGAAPTRGLSVRTQEVGSWSGSTPNWVTTSRTTYDAHGRSVDEFDALDRKTTTAYTPTTGGPVTATSVTDPLGHTASTVLEPAWQLPTRTTDANGHRAEMTYDGAGRLTAVWLPGRNRSNQSANLQFSYLLRNNAPSAVTSRALLPNGTGYRTSISLLDGSLRDRQTQTQAPGGGRVITDTWYDSRGLTTRVSRGYFNSANPSTTLVGTAGQPQIPGLVDYIYDGAGRTTAEIFRAAGQEQARTSYAYGGDRVSVTPPAGGTASMTITNARGQTTALRQYHGPAPSGTYDQTSYTYTKRGELATVTDPDGNTWTYSYDQRGRQTSLADPGAGLISTAYDAAGQIVTTTDGRGVTLGYTYDALGRRTSVRDGSPTGAKRAEWVFDTLPNGKGSLTRSIRYDGGNEYLSEVTGYDVAGRLTGTRVTIPGAETGLAGSYSTSYTYLPDGSLHTTDLPALADLPAELLTHAYNDVGAPTWLLSQHVTYASAVVYNKFGQLTQRTLGSFGKRVAVTNVYDEPTSRLVNSSAIPEALPEIFDLAYSYDAAGNLLRIADSPGSATPNDTQCYRYDHQRRLVQAWTPAATAATNCTANPTVAGLGGAAPYWHSWSYGLTGNRLTETRHAAAGNTVTSYTHPNPGSVRPHAVTQADTTGPGGATQHSYSYDAAGNMTGRVRAGQSQNLTWDAEGNLASVTENGVTTSYVYDADGNRLIARDATGRTLYLPNGSELRRSNTTGTNTASRYYTHLGSTIAQRTAAGVTWLLTDHHNTAEVAVNAADLTVARRRTLPFGETRGAAPAFWGGDKGFLSGTQDPTGLTHVGARMYDPALGRFISVDPIMDLNQPQQAHGYAYANNNPATWSDPSGLWINPPCGWCQKVANTFNKAKQAVVNTYNSVKNTVVNTYNTVKKAVVNTVKKVVNAVKKVVQTVVKTVVKVAQRAVNVAKEAARRIGTYATYTADTFKRRASNPVQTVSDLVSGTVLLEEFAAFQGIIGEGGTLKRDGDYCGSDAACIVGVSVPPGAAAITLGHTVRFSRDPSDPLVAHEMQHVYDIEGVGTAAFYLTYGLDYGIRRGRGQDHDSAYHDIYWERRAYYVQNNYSNGARPRGWPGGTWFETLGPAIRRAVTSGL